MCGNGNYKRIQNQIPINTPIKAIEGGKVTKSGLQNKNDPKEGFGQRVTIKHEWGTSTYAHMNDVPSVNKDEIVEAGEQLGEVGDSGNGSGVHLHFEMKDKNGKEIEPTEEQIQKLLDMLNEGCK
jgi:murein DD-endopeptidase MepM/ murein hydrolase activator NlpD